MGREEEMGLLSPWSELRSDGQGEPGGSLENSSCAGQNGWKQEGPGHMEARAGAGSRLEARSWVKKLLVVYW